MDIELRPLTLGEILDRTFQLYRARFVMFAGIATVAAALRIAWQAFSVLGTQILPAQHIAPLLWSGITSLSGFVSLGVTIVALALTLAATARAVSAIYLGKTTGIAQAYSEVRGRWFRYVRLNLTAFLVAWAPSVLVLVAVVLCVAISAKARTLTGAHAITAVYAAIALVFLATVPLGVWLTLRYSLANAASVFEDLGVRKALRRSVILSKGMRGRIFLILLVATAAQTMFSSLFLAPAYVLLVRTPRHIPIGVTIYTLAAGFVIGSLTMPIYGIALTLCYYDARIRKEGFDVEWMLERTMPDESRPLAAEAKSEEVAGGYTVGEPTSGELPAG